MGRGQAVDDDGAGVAEGVVLSVADDGVEGRDRREELRCGGGVAAVVPDLQERCGLDAVVGQHGRFAGCFRVAFEQDTGTSVVETDDQRVVVDRRAGVRIGCFGCEDGCVQIGPRERLAGVQVANDHVLGAGLRE